MVTPVVAVIDSNNVTELESAPGDFTSLDDSGEQRPLQTYGNVVSCIIIMRGCLLA